MALLNFLDKEIFMPKNELLIFFFLSADRSEIGLGNIELDPLPRFPDLRDAGNYSCIATSGRIETARTFQVVVEGEAFNV